MEGEQIQPVQMKSFALDWPHFEKIEDIKRSSELKTNTCIDSFLELIQHIQLAIRSARTDIAAVFHVLSDSRFTDRKPNLRR